MRFLKIRSSLYCKPECDKRDLCVNAIWQSSGVSTPSPAGLPFVKPLGMRKLSKPPRTFAMAKEIHFGNSLHDVPRQANGCHRTVQFMCKIIT